MMIIILVDGIWGTGAIFEPFRSRLTAQGYQCLVPSLNPNNAAFGIVDLAEKLKRFIQRLQSADAKAV
jgi:hypothetical protein